MRTTLTTILDDHARGHPDRLLYAFYGGDGALRESYTYAAFVRRADFIAERLRDTGLSRGDVALLVYPPGLDVTLAFFACARIGVIPAPAPMPAQSRRHPGWKRLAHIAEQAGAGFVLTTTAMVERLRADQGSPRDVFAGAPDLRWIATEIFDGESDGIDETASQTLFLQYTSGSTSLPRGVAVTHENVIHNADLAVDHSEPVYVSWLPHFHDLGLIGVLLSCAANGGTAHCFSPLDFMRRPALWFRLISEQRATMTAAPNAAYAYCLRADKIGDAELNGVDLRSLRLMVNCAEPVMPDTFDRFAQRFAAYGLRPSAYVAGYGLAEHTLCVTTGGQRQFRLAPGDPATDIDTSKRAPLVSCGRPPGGINIRIVDPRTRRPMTDREVGEIWVDSPSKAAGYWRLPKATVQRFEARLTGDADSRRFLRTGDLGFLDEGELFVCGRLSDMMIVNGRNIFPNDIEALIARAVPATLAGHIVAFGAHDGASAPERLVVLVEAAEDAVDLKHLCHIVQDGFELSDGTVVRVPRGTIVRTSSGKLARQHCRDNWESGAIEELERADFDERDFNTDGIDGLLDALAARARTLGEPDASLDQLGLDSITLVDLSLQLEKLLESHGLASPEMKERVADLSLLQALRVSDLRSGFSLLATASPDSAAIPQFLTDAATAVRRQEEVQMLSDAALPLPDPCPEVGKRGSILITGATGFLGSFLTRSLIEITESPIIALVRCDDRAHGTDRMRRALLDTDMAPEAVATAIATRLELVPGDVSQSRFALSDASWQALTANVEAIYHCAADVDYVKSYGLLRAANVLGTREVIRFASERRRKSLHHISTTFVHGWSTKRIVYEGDVDQPIEDLDFGYAQSKWVAEQLVVRARHRGLPATIYRPSLVTASDTARFVEHDIVARLVGYMIRHGLTVDAANQVSFLPVDVCARNIAAISQAPSAPPPILHMTVDDYYRIADVCSAISDIFGYRFDCVSLESFVEHTHAHCQESDPFFPLLSFLSRNTGRIRRMGDKRYDSRDYRRARRAAPLAVAHADLHATVDPIVRYLNDEGLIQPAPFAPSIALGPWAIPQPA